MLRTLLATAAASLALVLSHPVSAHEYKAGTLTIVHPWARATPASAKVAGGFATIRNDGGQPDRLVSASAPEISGRVEIHEMAVKDGIMTMRELEKGLPLAPGSTTELKPGGYHVMFMELKRPLKQGEKITGTLIFEKAGPVGVEFNVESMGAREGGHGGPAMPSGHGH